MNLIKVTNTKNKIVVNKTDNTIKVIQRPNKIIVKNVGIQGAKGDTVTKEQVGLGVDDDVSFASVSIEKVNDPAYLISNGTLTAHWGIDTSDRNLEFGWGSIVGVGTFHSVNIYGKTTLSSLNLNNLTASELIATDASKNIISLPVATYPSLIELSYVKGVTSAIQTQLNGKEPTLGYTPYNATNPNNYIPLTALSASFPLSYNNTTGAFAFGYNATNLKLTADQLNTIQDIATASSPTFTGLNLSGLTASTSLQLGASKEIVSVANTGTGDNVLATSPNLVTPNLGTPSAGVLTNCTGTASGLTAGTATVANTISIANEAADTTCFPLFVTDSGTQTLQPKSSTSLLYNSANGDLASALMTSGGFYGKSGTPYAMNSAVITGGNIALNNGTTDSPAIHFARGDNLNYGIDTFGNKLRFVRDLDEATGLSLMEIDPSGNLNLPLLTANTALGLDASKNFVSVPYSYGVVIGNGVQAIPNTSTTSLTSTYWNVSSTVNGSVSYSNGVFTVSSAGFYQISANMSFTNNATGSRSIVILVNNTNTRGYETKTANPFDRTGMTCSAGVYLNAGDNVRVSVFQGSGISVNTDTLIPGLFSITKTGGI